MINLLRTILFTLLALPAAAENIGDDGKYYQINGDKYITKSAQSIKSPGQYGMVTGKQPIIGIFIRNGFGHEGYTSTGGVLSGTQYSVRGDLVAKLNGGVSLAVGSGPNLSVEGDTSIDSSKTYKAIHVSVNDWQKIYEELNKLADELPPGSNIFKKNFRIIDSVVYVTGYSEDTTISFGTEVSGKLEPPQGYSVTASVSADGTKSDSLLLSDGSAIAFTMRHLCWNDDGMIVSAAVDIVGEGRPADCKRYR